MLKVTISAVDYSEYRPMDRHTPSYWSIVGILNTIQYRIDYIHGRLHEFYKGEKFGESEFQILTNEGAKNKTV